MGCSNAFTFGEGIRSHGFARRPRSLKRIPKLFSLVSGFGDILCMPRLVESTRIRRRRYSAAPLCDHLLAFVRGASRCVRHLRRHQDERAGQYAEEKKKNVQFLSPCQKTVYFKSSILHYSIHLNTCQEQRPQIS